MARPNMPMAVIFVVVVIAMAATASGGHHRRRVPVPPPPPPQQDLDFNIKTYCTDARGVHAGDTCASVARDAGVPLPRFMELNPNVTCGKLFLGQWLCVDSVDVA